MSASEVYAPTALPSEMNYQLPPSLPSAKNTEIRIQPLNAQSFQKGNTIQVDLPTGRNTYLDTTTAYIRYKITYTQPAVGAVANDYNYLLGSSYSPFIRQEVYGNNSVLLESINEVGVLASTILNSQLNGADKRGLSPAFGFAFDAITSADSNIGHKIWQTQSTTNLDGLVFDYATPLIGILGSGTDKMIPLGHLMGLRFELTCDDVLNFTNSISANRLVGYTITDFEFVANIIELAPEANALISQANPEKIYIRSQSYRQSSAILNASAGVGTYDLLCGIRCSSLKSLYVQCYNSNMADLKYGSIFPNLTQGTCILINGLSYPQRTMDVCGKPGDAFMELQKALGALSLSVFNGCINKSAYYRSSTASGLCQAYNSSTAYAFVAGNPNQALLGIDTEVVARKNNLLSGINCNNSPMFFRAQIGTALAAYAHTVNFFGNYDVILEIDVASKSIIAKF